MLDNSEQFFSKATQTVFILVEKLLNEHKHSPCDLNDLYYFGCVFLGILASRLNNDERISFRGNLREILNTAAHDGVVMCTEIMSANLVSEEDRDKAMHQLISNLKGTENAESALLVPIAEDINLLSMKEDSLWKSRNDLKYESGIEKAIQSSFENLIDQVINNVPKSQNNTGSKPELIFLVTAVINIGLMAGYLSILFRQSLDEFIHLGINKINELMLSDEKNKSLLH